MSEASGNRGKLSPPLYRALETRETIAFTTLGTEDKSDYTATLRLVNVPFEIGDLKWM